MRSGRIKYLLLLLPLLLVMPSCSQNFDEKGFVGKWKYDVESVREQMFTNGKLKRIKKNEEQIQAFIKPMETLVVEYKADHGIHVVVDSVEQTGKWELREGQFFVTIISGIEKVYKIKAVESDKLILLETMPKSPIREYILHRQD